MPVIVFTCPFCGEKVETSESNVGREGQCPSCQKIYKIPNPNQARAAQEAAHRTLAGRLPIEYREGNIVVALGAMGLGLALMVAGGILPWVEPDSWARSLVAAQRYLILAGSAVCLAAGVLSALLRRSQLPPVLVSGAWGSFAVIWAGAIWQYLGNGAVLGEAPAVSVNWPAYLVMFGAAILAGGSIFVYSQAKGIPALPNFGIHLTILLVVAGGGAFYLSGRHLRPRIREAATAVVDANQARREAERLRRANRETLLELNRVRLELKQLKEELEPEERRR